MISLYRGTTAEVFLSLGEKVTLSAPHFLFVFRSRLKGTEVVAVIAKDEDYTGRCERFTFDVTAVFGDAPEGQYLYTVHEQEDAANVLPSLAGRVVEEGIATLKTDRAFQYTQKSTATQFIQPK